MIPSRRVSFRHALPALLLVAGLVTGPAHAIVSPEQSIRDIDRLQQDDWLQSREAAHVRASLQGSPAWLEWCAQHPGWRVTWNPRTRTAHRVYGPGVRLDLGLAAPASVETACRDFLARTEALTGVRGEELHLLRAQHSARRWYVIFEQTHAGLPVLGGRADLRLGEAGEIALFGADWYRDVQVDARPSLPVQAALGAACRDLGAAPAQVQSRLVIAPEARGAGYVHHLAHELRFRTEEPLGAWVALVDAHTGELLRRENRIRYGTLRGHITAQIESVTVGDPYAEKPLRDTSFRDATGDSSVYSDFTGAFDLFTTNRDSVNVTLPLAGRFGKVYNHSTNLSNPQINTRMLPGSPRDFRWDDSNSKASERDAYHSALVAHQYLKELDPTFTEVDAPMPITVDRTDGRCNAYWDGLGINFYIEGGGCVNTARIADVVYHEYGHGITDWQYRPLSPSGAMHEGFSDYYGATIRNDSRIGLGFRGPGTSLRNVDNTLRAPDDLNGEVHHDGLILAGALWDLRQALGRARADTLFHFARYGGADNFDDYLLDVLATDDDDADIYNGTPRFDVIIDAFKPHGIGDYNVQITHQEEPDTEDPSKVLQLEASILSIFALDASSLKLHYAVNGGVWKLLPLAPEPGIRLFAATIPAQTAGSTIRYYIAAADTAGNAASLPPEGEAAPFEFWVGTDTTPPLIVHAPIPDRPIEAPGWPVRAQVTDNLDHGLAAVTLEYSRNSTALDLSLPLSPTGLPLWQTAFPAIGASVGDTFYYRITATDSAKVPNVALSPGAGQHSFRVVNGWRFDLEADDGGLVGDGDWQWDVVTQGPGTAYSGTHAWSNGFAGTYRSDQESNLTSGGIDLAGWSRASLVFQHWLKSEPAYDGGCVEVSTDSGVTWTTLVPNGGYPVDVVSALYGPGYSGDSQGWQLAEFDLSQYLGQQVRLRGRFASDPGVVGPGWYIDDIEVAERQVLSVPLGLQAQSGLDSQVKLRWTPPAGLDPNQPGTPLQGYHVYRALQPDLGDAVRLTGSAVGTERFTDATATNGTTYWYAVSAVYAEGESRLTAGAAGMPYLAGYASNATALHVTVTNGGAADTSLTFTNTGTGFLDLDAWLGDATDGIDSVRIAYGITTPPAAARPASSIGFGSDRRPSPPAAKQHFTRRELLARLVQHLGKLDARGRARLAASKTVAPPLASHHATGAAAAPANGNANFRLLYTDTPEDSLTPDLKDFLVKEENGQILFRLTGYATWGNILQSFNMIIGIDADASRGTGDEDGMDLYIVCGVFPMQQVGIPAIIVTGQHEFIGVPTHMVFPDGADFMEVGIPLWYLSGSTRVRLDALAMDASMQAPIDLLPNPRFANVWMRPAALRLAVPAGQPTPLGLAFPGQVPAGRYAGKLFLETNDPSNPTATIAVNYDFSESPVALFDLATEQDRADVLVRWRTGQEKDVAAFRVFRARDGGALEALAPELEPSREHRYTFRDPNPEPGRYAYRIGEVSPSGAVVLHGRSEIDVVPARPRQTFLDPALPNPFNPITTLRFGLAQSGPAELVLYDARGRRVRSLLPRAHLDAGYHQLVWDGRDDRGRQVASGIYHAQLVSSGRKLTQRLVLLK